jgi:hypothetical protein
MHFKYYPWKDRPKLVIQEHYYLETRGSGLALVDAQRRAEPLLLSCCPGDLACLRAKKSRGKANRVLDTGVVEYWSLASGVGVMEYDDLWLSGVVEY